MPSNPISLMRAADLQPSGVVRWGDLVPASGPGVYLVSLGQDPGPIVQTIAECPLDRVALEQLLQDRPGLTIDGERPTSEHLGDRLASFWLPDESVVYIGLAGTGLGMRVDQYYRTRLGARSPHAGGWFLKTLSVLSDLYVHYAACSGPAKAETRMLGAFCAAVSKTTKARLRDPDHPFPFANLEWPKGVRKRHGISGAKATRKRRTPVENVAPRSLKRPAHRSTQAMTPDLRTQRITAADLSRGQIRIPRGPSKDVFPSRRGQVDIVLREMAVSCRWDPRYGPPERSGVLTLGKRELPRLVSEDEVLRLEPSDGGLKLT